VKDELARLSVIGKETFLSTIAHPQALLTEKKRVVFKVLAPENVSL